MMLELLDTRCKHCIINELVRRERIPQPPASWSARKKSMEKVFAQITPQLVAGIPSKEWLRVPNLGRRSALMIEKWLRACLPQHGWIAEFDELRGRDLDAAEKVVLNNLFREFIDTLPPRGIFGPALSNVLFTADMLHAILERSWRTNLRDIA